MNVAFLFNSNHQTLGAWYGGSVMEIILKAGALRTTKRQMRISVGDILTHFSFNENTRDGSMIPTAKLNQEVYKPHEFDRLLHPALEETLGKSVLYCWFFQNIDSDVAESLHTSLTNNPSYLGAMDIEFTNPLQLTFFRNLLIEDFRLNGLSASQFYDMSENEGPDVAYKEIFEESGFSYFQEDSGARHTIFDRYNHLEHFQRIADFKRLFKLKMGWSESDVSDLIFFLEEIHPQLFDILAAATRTLERSETSEDLAQVALSGRRFLELLADTLYPPSTESIEGHDLGKNKYKNRLWVYIKATLLDKNIVDDILLNSIGERGDVLFELFNSGLHRQPVKEKVERSLSDLAHWTLEIILISPEHTRRPYAAYHEEISSFIERVESGASSES